MKKFAALGLSAAVVLSLAIAPSAQAKVKVTKPAAPTVASIFSSPVKKGKVNITFAITLPTNTGGAKITGSKVRAGGKSCTIKGTKTSCTIKGITNGKALNVIAQTKNKKGFGARSVGVSYVAGAAAFSALVIPAAPVVPVVPVVPAPSPPAPSPPALIGQNALTLSLNGVTSATYNGSAFSQALTLSTAGGSGTGAVSYSILTGSAAACALTGSGANLTLTTTTDGYCRIVSTKAADSAYLAITSAHQDFTFNNAVISSAAIVGLEVPIPGASVDTTVNSGTGYSATVAWKKTSDESLVSTFASATQYTATITLTPTTGYTFSGVPQDFFTVAGNAATANTANNSVVTAEFPIGYALDDTGPAGGKIFITPNTPGNTTGQYFEAAVADLIGDKIWCTSSAGAYFAAGEVGAPGTGIGTGKTNTAEIVGGVVGSFCQGGAAVEAKGHNGGGKTDWFLPSADELNQLCRYAKIQAQSTETCAAGDVTRGALTTLSYWSSSEIVTPYQAARYQTFNLGGQGILTRLNAIKVRPVRSFSAYAIGSVGPAGGRVFMTPSTQGGLGGDSYYEAAPTGWGNGIAVNPSITIDGISFAAEITGTSTTDPQLRWCNNPTATVGVTSTAIGTGKANTAAIVSGGDVNCTLGAGFTADGYTSTGATPYSDWFLPSFDEINQLCRYAGEAAQSTEPCSNSGSLRVGFVAASFGSSSELDPSQNWIQSFATAGSGGGSKGATSYIRPVRSFQ